jgi:hypothetical protein
MIRYAGMSLPQNLWPGRAWNFRDRTIVAEFLLSWGHMRSIA